MRHGDDSPHPFDLSHLDVKGPWVLLAANADGIATVHALVTNWRDGVDERWTRIDGTLLDEEGAHHPAHLLAPTNGTLPATSMSAVPSNVFSLRAEQTAGPDDDGALRLDSSVDERSIRFLPTVVREGQTLLSALPVAPCEQDPAVQSGIFVVDAKSASMPRLVGRLLRLGFDTGRVSKVAVDDAEHHLLRLDGAPFFVVLSAKEDPSQFGRYYERIAPTLYVEWGFAHLLPDLAAAAAATCESVALIDRDGRWLLLPSQQDSEELLDVILPTLPHKGRSLAPRSATDRPVDDKFEIRLRLEATQPAVAELWLVGADQFAKLGDALYAATPEEVERLTVARLANRDGRAFYLLRERTAPGQTQMGHTLSALFESSGFVRLEGTDNFFLPAGRRLRPRLRRDALRQLLRLEDNAIVLLEEDADGVQLTTIHTVDEQPITRWIELVATDRRRELDRMLEDAVLSFPAISIDEPPPQRSAPPPTVTRPKKRGVRKEKPKPGDQPRRPKAANQMAPDVDLDTEALLAQARPLELEIAVGGHANPKTWSDLGHLREALEDSAQAATCYETALFLLGEPYLRDAMASDTEQQRSLERLIFSRRQSHPLEVGSDDAFLELLTRERKIAAEASLLGAIAIERLLRQDPVAIDALPHLIQVFRDRELPVSRRLAWSVLCTAHLATDDALGLTRAKESILGGLNEKGLNEAYDLPRFVRLELALDEGDDVARASRTRVDQLNALESLWEVAVGEAVEGFDVDAAYLRAQFGVGFARLGALGNARALVRPLEEELPAHDEPNRVLLSLYLARLAHAGTQGDQAAWKAEVSASLSSVENIRIRRTVEWLRKRSSWLNPDKEAAPSPWIRPEFERKLASAEGDGRGFAEVIREAFRTNELYDYELSSTVERMLEGALATGEDDTLSNTLDVAQGRLEKIQILGHRAAATGACIRAAATLGDLSRVDVYLKTIIDIARAPNVPSMRALLGAVEPALTALRKLGGSASGIRFLEAIEAVEVRSPSEQIRLTAAIADGLMNLEASDRPVDLIDAALEKTLTTEMDHVGRFEAATALVASLHHWSLSARTERCRMLLENLAQFRDTFTTSSYFGTHRILLCEAIVDALCDEQTVQSDRVHAFLDAEEKTIRQVIAADWSAVCGR